MTPTEFAARVTQQRRDYRDKLIWQRRKALADRRHGQAGDFLPLTPRSRGL